MKPSIRGKRGKQKVLALSRRKYVNNRSVNRYVTIDHFLTNFETAYFTVTGIRVEVTYHKGSYYLGSIKWDHNRLEKELLKLLIREQEINRQLRLTEIGELGERTKGQTCEVGS